MPVYANALWCNRNCTMEPGKNNKAALYSCYPNNMSNANIGNRVTATARKTADLRRAVASDMPRITTRPSTDSHAKKQRI